ncbi:cytochrome oxidase Cu insertion factor (SCO1/SenC/PrrC family) [Paenibacillus jamilae]|nr:cytochrome oxidase Cu insertion factor (SCO1/SenC/PrrC family) [Paenibacillus jamilae]
MLAVIEIIYLINAIGYDIYKYPSILIILYLIISFITGKKKKSYKSMSDNELLKAKENLQKENKQTLKSFLKNFVWVVYFGYMFYCLVF